MGLIVRMFFLLFLMVFLCGATTDPPKEVKRPHLTGCELLGYIKGEDAKSVKKPTHEEQVAFVQDFPHCPPYEWWELMNGALLRAVEVSVEFTLLGAIPASFPEGTLFPKSPVDACGSCADAAEFMPFSRSLTLRAVVSIACWTYRFSAHSAQQKDHRPRKKSRESISMD